MINRTAVGEDPAIQGQEPQRFLSVTLYARITPGQDVKWRAGPSFFDVFALLGLDEGRGRHDTCGFAIGHKWLGLDRLARRFGPLLSQDPLVPLSR